jgi:hypothetical protein
VPHVPVDYQTALLARALALSLAPRATQDTYGQDLPASVAHIRIVSQLPTIRLVCVQLVLRDTFGQVRDVLYAQKLTA